MARHKRKSTEISQDDKDQSSSTPSGTHTNKNGPRGNHSKSNNNKSDDATQTKNTQQQTVTTTKPYNNKSKYDKNNIDNKSSQKKERKEWPADQTWSKSKKKRMRTLKAKHLEKNDEDDGKQIQELTTTTNSTTLFDDKKNEKNIKMNNDTSDVTSQTDPIVTKSKRKRNKKAKLDPLTVSTSSEPSDVPVGQHPVSDDKEPLSSSSQVQEDLVKSPTTSKVTEPTKISAITKKSDSDKKKTTTTPITSQMNKFQERLLGSRFRILNEELYTTTSNVAYERFQKDPQLFQQYHDGFRYQVQDWPINPVNVMVQKLKKDMKTFIQQQQQQEQIGSSSSITKNEETNNQSKKLVIADFGCGEAQLAKELLNYRITDNNKTTQPKDDGNIIKKSKKKSNPQYCPFKVHSFDLIAPNELVTACDMSHVPIKSNTVDVGIFCLSLMGTNLVDFIREAYRVLKNNDAHQEDDDDEKKKNDTKRLRRNSRIYIAEVRSRFESIVVPKEETDGMMKEKKNKNKFKTKKQNNNKTMPQDDSHCNQDELNKFLAVCEQLGFYCCSVDRTNPFFMVLELEKRKPRLVPNNNDDDEHDNNDTNKNDKDDDYYALTKNVQYTPKPCIYKRR